MGAANWFYSRQGQKYGPFTVEGLKRYAQSGELQPTDLVWCSGMAEWVPAQSAPFFKQAAGMPDTSAEAATLDSAERLRLNAHVNCRMMFGLLLFFVLALGIETVSRTTTDAFLSKRGVHVVPRGTDILFGLMLLGTGVFAAIYVPLRWNVIKQVRNPARVLGLIGGFGLMLLLLISIIAIFFLVAS